MSKSSFSLLYGLQLPFSTTSLVCIFSDPKAEPCVVLVAPPLPDFHWRHCHQNIQLLRWTPHTTPVLWRFFCDHPGEPVPEENFWTLCCKGRLTEADTPTIWLGTTPSGLISAHLHHTPALNTATKNFCPLRHYLAAADEFDPCRWHGQCYENSRVDRMLLGNTNWTRA